MEPTDFDLAVSAITRARLLTNRIQMMTETATEMAVTLLLDKGFSHREIAQLTGVSKSTVGRRAKNRAIPIVAVQFDGDKEAYDFAAAFIWGSYQKFEEVMSRVEARPRPIAIAEEHQIDECPSGTCGHCKRCEIETANLQ